VKMDDGLNAGYCGGHLLFVIRRQIWTQKLIFRQK
jgi:hypothetical protein